LGEEQVIYRVFFNKKIFISSGNENNFMQTLFTAFFLSVTRMIIELKVPGACLSQASKL
jgi:hypothetical protein